jgi:hypothetical protein
MLKGMLAAWLILLIFRGSAVALSGHREAVET